MKFIHTADLHLGKFVCGVSQLPYQEEALNEMLQYATTYHIPAIVIAGDIYDRSIPNVDAVELFNRFLIQCNSYNIAVLCISGNHDSEGRLNFGTTFFSHNQVYIVSKLEETMPYVDIEDTRFYFLPFAKPNTFKLFDLELPSLSYNLAMERYMAKQSIDTTKNTVLITHHFIAGSLIESESEQPLMVGGTDQIDAHLFDQFDYVALGHLHAPQKVGRESMRYSGSPLRYSFDECKQHKSFTIVEIINHQVTIQLEEFRPSKTLKVLKGSFSSLLEGKDDHFIAFELTDHALIPNAMDQLKEKYPNAMQLSYVDLNEEEVESKSLENIQSLDDLTLFKEFYKGIRNQELEENEIKIIQDLLSGGEEE